MKQYKYKVLKKRRFIQKHLETILNEYEREGWELVIAFMYDLGVALLMFKKEI